MVRKLFEEFNARRFDEMLSVLDLAIEYRVRQDEPEGGTHRGHEALVAHLRGWIDLLPDVHIETQELHESADWVIAVTRLCGIGTASGVEVDDTYVFANRVRDGVIMEINEYAALAEALEAVDKT